MKFWKKIDRFPPVACRLLARHKYGKPLSSQEIAVSSGLSILRVEAISDQTSWRGIDVLELRAFTEACGIHLEDHAKMKRIEQYIARAPKFTYLKRSSLWESYYAPLFRKWIKYEQQRTAIK